MAAQSSIDVGDRPVPEEPLYLIFNLAISTAFTTIDYDGLAPYFPMHMDIDYVRVYQDPDLKVRSITAAFSHTHPKTLCRTFADALLSLATCRTSVATPFVLPLLFATAKNYSPADHLQTSFRTPTQPRITLLFTRTLYTLTTTSRLGTRGRTLRPSPRTACRTLYARSSVPDILHREPTTDTPAPFHDLPTTQC